MQKQTVRIFSVGEINTMKEILRDMNSYVKCCKKDSKQVKCITCHQSGIEAQIRTLRKLISGSSYLND